VFTGYRRIHGQCHDADGSRDERESENGESETPYHVLLLTVQHMLMLRLLNHSCRTGQQEQAAAGGRRGRHRPPADLGIADIAMSLKTPDQKGEAAPLARYFGI
jgi:hypothetical protein